MVGKQSKSSNCLCLTSKPISLISSITVGDRDSPAAAQRASKAQALPRARPQPAHSLAQATTRPSTMMATASHIPQHHWQVPSPRPAWNHGHGDPGGTSPNARAGIQSHVDTVASLETLIQTADKSAMEVAPCASPVVHDSFLGDLDTDNCFSDDILDLYLPDDSGATNGSWSPSHRLAVASDKVARTPRADMRLEPEPELGKLRKSVSIGRLSVVRTCDKDSPPGVKDISATDHNELTRDTDGPREVTSIVDKLIVTHFESWMLCDAGAVINFVGPVKFAELGKTILGRLEEIVEKAAGAEHVGMLPSCVRIGPTHLEHLSILIHWVTMAFQSHMQEQGRLRSPSYSSSSPESDSELNHRGRRNSDAFTGPGAQATVDDECCDNGWGWSPDSPNWSSDSPKLPLSPTACGGWSPGVDADDEDNGMMHEEEEEGEGDMQVDTVCKGAMEGMIGLMLDESSFGSMP